LCCLFFCLFLLVIVLSVLLRYKDSDYPFGIFKLFLILFNTVLVLTTSSTGKFYMQHVLPIWSH
jgi:hypothetical protein